MKRDELIAKINELKKAKATLCAMVSTPLTNGYFLSQISEINFKLVELKSKLHCFDNKRKRQWQ